MTNGDTSTTPVDPAKARFTMSIDGDGEHIRFTFKDRGIVRASGEARDLLVLEGMFERFKAERRKVAAYG